MEDRRGGDPAARARWLCDRIELEAVMTRYLCSVDRRDWEGCRACFTPQAETTYRGQTMPIDAAIDLLDHDLAATTVSTHVLAGHQADVEGDEALAQSYAWVLGRSSSDLMLGARYNTRFARIDGRWLITWNQLETCWIQQRTLPA